MVPVLSTPTSQVKAKVDEMELPVTFHDAIDHAELGKYKVRVRAKRSVFRDSRRVGM